MEEQRNDRSIGALWVKQGKRGMYFSGVVEIEGKKTSIVVFQNNKKSKPNQPDYSILVSTPMGERPADIEEDNQSKLNNLDTSSSVVDEEIDPADIPF